MLPRWIHAPACVLTRALFDLGHGVPEARLTWLLDDLGDFLGRAGAKTRLAFLLTMLVVEWAPPLFGTLGRMSRLSPEARARYLARLDASPLSVVLVAPKAMIGLCYCEHPEVLAELGYTPRVGAGAPR